MTDCSYQIFVGFAAEDRYTIAEPIVYHLKNYGVNTWYDRHTLLLGDNRRKKNLDEGIRAAKYACIVISRHTTFSICAMEEFSLVKERYMHGEMTVFPVLYELSPANIPSELQWVKELIFKEADRHSGTREICNHISCKISTDLLANCPYKSISDILTLAPSFIPAANAILCSYQMVDTANLNSRISLLYATYLSIIHSTELDNCTSINMVQQIFERLFSETKLNLTVDYRDIWLLENVLCILVNHCLETDTESRI